MTLVFFLLNYRNYGNLPIYADIAAASRAMVIKLQNTSSSLAFSVTVFLPLASFLGDPLSNISLSRPCASLGVTDAPQAPCPTEYALVLQGLTVPLLMIKKVSPLAPCLMIYSPFS